MYQFTIDSSPLGRLTMASDGKNLTGLWIEGQKYFEAQNSCIGSGEIGEERQLPVFDEAKDWLRQYFAGEKPLISELPLCPEGSRFRQEVWKLLCQIPYGEVTTYGALAQKMAAQMGKNHMSAQAVGGAVSHNPVSIIIPCHRVVGADGSLTGYAGGTERKLWLLEHEECEITRFLSKKEKEKIFINSQKVVENNEKQ